MYNTLKELAHGGYIKHCPKRVNDQEEAFPALSLDVDNMFNVPPCMYVGTIWMDAWIDGWMY